MSSTRKAFVKIFVCYGLISCVGICQFGCSNCDSRSVAALIAKLKKGDYQTRIEAFAALKTLGADAKTAIPVLMKMLEDNDPNIRAAAAETLGGIGIDANAAVPILISKLEHDKDRYVRCASAKALSGIGVKDHATYSALKRALADSETRVQIGAAAALALLDPDSHDAISTFTKLLKNKDDAIRELAATFLGGIKSLSAKSAIPSLLIALHDSEIGVRQSAATSLGNICEDSEIVVPALIERINSEKSAIARSSVIQALGEYGPEAKAAIPALTLALKDSNHDVRTAAAQSLDYTKTWKRKRGLMGKQEEYEKVKRLENEIDEKIKGSKWTW